MCVQCMQQWLLSHLSFLVLLSPQQSVTLVSPWIRNSPLLPTFTRFAVPVTTSSANSAQFPAHSSVLPQPPLSIRLSPPGLTTVMMMVLCPKAGSWAFTPPGDEMSEVGSRCLPHRQLWVSNLSKVATQWREVDSNPRPFDCKAQNLPPTPRRPIIIIIIIIIITNQLF